MRKFTDDLVSWERAAAVTLCGMSVVALSSTVAMPHLLPLAALLVLSFAVGYRTDLGRSEFLRKGISPTAQRVALHLIGVFFVVLLVGVALEPALLLGMLFVFPLLITSPGMQAAIVFLDASVLAYGISDERWIGDARAAAFAVLMGATFALHHHAERVRRNRAPYRAGAASVALTGATMGAIAAAAALPLHVLVPSLSPVEPGPAEDMKPVTIGDLLVLLGYFAIVTVLFAVLLRILQRFRLVAGVEPDADLVSASVVAQEAMSSAAGGPARPREARWTVVRLYHRLFERLRPAGVLVLASSTPTERTTTLARRASTCGEEIERLTDLFHRARYSTEPIGGEDVQRMRTWTESVRRAAQGAGALLALWAAAALGQDPAATNRLARAVTYRAHTYDILSYDIEARIEPEARSMRARAGVRVRMKQDAATLRFLIHKDAHIERVRCGGAEWAARLSRFVPQLPANLLDLTPPAPVAEGAELSLSFEYLLPSRGKEPEPHAPWVTSDWAWVDLASGWYPLMLYETFESRITLDVPEAWDGVATGTMESDEATGGRRRLVFAGARNALLGFVCGRYRRALREVDGRRLAILSIEEVPAEVRDRAFDQTADLFRLYGSLYGDPEVKDFTLAEMPPGDPSRPHNARTFAVLPSNEWACAASEKAESIWYAALSHEVAHCWFGHLVTSDVMGRGGNWLREGLAEYSSYVALERRYGAGPWVFRRAIATYLGDIAALGEREPPLREMSYVFDRDTSYEKGAWVFRMIRHEVGAEAFDRALRRYVSERRGRFATDADIREVFEAESGRDLAALFKDWEEGSGRFDLAIAGAPEREASGGWALRLTPKGTLRCPARMEVRWREAGGKEGAIEADVAAEGGRVALPASSPPESVEIDARNDYLDVDPWNNTWPPRVRSGLWAVFMLRPQASFWVYGVEDGSPSAKAGLRLGDWVTSVGGRSVLAPDDLPAALWDLREGGSLLLVVRRGDAEIEATLR